MIGRTLQHYKIVDRLGVGGMGEVYLAEDTKLGRNVALKILPPETADDPVRLARLQREARAVASLNHPNIVTVHAVEEAETETGSMHFFTMELVRGMSLRQSIATQNFGVEKVLEIAESLADAVSAAHHKNITHQDLKPANIMLSDEGRVKVLDFGLAKLRPEAEGPAPTQTLTQEGKVLGTLPYMAPEQLAGERGDPRSDVFSIGVILYEMATGKHPFSADTWPETVSAIVREDPPSVTDINENLPEELASIVGNCIEKRPERRYQSADQLRDDLRNLRRQVDYSQSTGSLPLTRPQRRRRAILAWGAALVLLVVGVLLVPALLRQDDEGGTTVSVRPDTGKPSIAVMYFQNLSQDPDLDWLRVGFADMLVTSLAQSDEIEVLSTDRLYQILRDLDKLDEPMISADVVQAVARRAGVDMVVVGSFFRGGAVVQVGIKVQDARSSDILSATNDEADFRTGLFGLANVLSVHVLEDVAGTAGGQPVRQIEDVTTRSLEAYRYYIEGRTLSLQIKYDEALRLLEKAVEIDPHFAMALAEIGIVHETLGHTREAREYTTRAFESADRLSPYERHYVEGRFYGQSWSTYDEAIEAFETAVALKPDRAPARYDLILVYGYVERFEDAIREANELREWGHEFTGGEYTLATMHAALGDFDTGHEILGEYVAENPDQWAGFLALGWHLIHKGDQVAALEAYDRAEDRHPGDPWIPFGRYRAHMLLRNHEEAERAAEELARSEDPSWRWRGVMNQARHRLFHGEVDEAVALLELAEGIHEEPGSWTAVAEYEAADYLRQIGRPEEALAIAEKAWRGAPEEWPGREGLYESALALQELGRAAEADERLAELEAAAGDTPNVVERRQIHRLTGLLAVARGDTATAIAELTAAEELLSPRGIRWNPNRIPDHVPVWYALAVAHETAGDTGEAIEWYRRVVESGYEYLEYPVRYVRSFYRLGKLHEARGNSEKAKECFDRFLHHWGDGEIDRAAVSEAARGVG
jgi:serine/threonine protein kinase/tetratricopeptide (TPR) repeat protein